MPLQSLPKLTQLSFYRRFIHHWQPLKRRKRLWHKRIYAQSERTFIFLVFQIFFKANRQRNDRLDILGRFPRQADHEVEPVMAKSRRNPHIQRPPEMFLRNPLIDRRPHAVTARLGRHCQCFHSAPDKRIHQRRGYRIHAKRSDRHRKSRCQNIAAKLIDFRVIGNRRPHQPDAFLIRSGRQDLILQHLSGTNPRAAKAISGHAKTAMTAAAPRGFNKI